MAPRRHARPARRGHAEAESVFTGSDQFSHDRSRRDQLSKQYQQNTLKRSQNATRSYADTFVYAPHSLVIEHLDACAPMTSRPFFMFSVTLISWNSWNL